MTARLLLTQSRLRYVAVTQGRRIVEMVQGPQHPSYNPPGATASKNSS
jgi:hypothetical protein